MGEPGKRRKVPKARPSEETYDIESTLRNIFVGCYSNEERGAREVKNGNKTDRELEMRDAFHSTKTSGLPNFP